MHRPIEDTAYCLDCASEWPVTWGSEEPTLACPSCRQLGVPKDLISLGWWTTQGHGEDANNAETDGRDLPLWDRVLGLIEQDLTERHSSKLFVEVPGKFGTNRKEIGKLSASERQSLRPALREHVVERLLDRYLANQGRVDLVEKRRVYTKKIQDLTPADLPALLEADRLRAEEEHQKERKRAEFVQETRADLKRLLDTGLPR